jgi:ribosomal-protein-alanine N-acetyltransferase
MKPREQLTMRAAHVSEASQIASLSRLHIEHGLSWRWTPKRVRRHVKDSESMVLVASVNGEIGGFAIMRFGDTEAHLFLLAVEPKMRRQGTGSAMVRWLEKSCMTAGIARIRLEVREGNRSAQEFYSRLGYSVLGSTTGYYDRRETAIIMGKSLYPDK